MMFGCKSNKSTGAAAAAAVIIQSKTTDHHLTMLLRCGICSHRLCGPIYWCEIGHEVSCKDCFIKSGGTCGLCLLPLRRERPLAEKFIKRCNRTLSYNKNQNTSLPRLLFSTLFKSSKSQQQQVIRAYLKDLNLLHCGVCNHKLCGPFYKCQKGHGTSCHGCYIKSRCRCRLCLLPFRREGGIMEEIIKRCNETLVPPPIKPATSSAKLHYYKDCELCGLTLMHSRIYHQCENGHVTCSSCCTRLRGRCRLCTWGYNNNDNNKAKAMGTLVEKTIVESNNKGCCSSSSSSKLSNRFTSFTYGDPFSIGGVEVGQKRLVMLQEENDLGVIFILNHEVLQDQTTIFFSVACVGLLPNKAANFIYKLTVRYKDGSCLSDELTNKGFLVVPSSVAPVSVEVCIDKVIII